MYITSRCFCVNHEGNYIQSQHRPRKEVADANVTYGRPIIVKWILFQDDLLRDTRYNMVSTPLS